jgi:SMC interacting uncharacterized protein involved in chromosome segregation
LPATITITEEYLTNLENDHQYLKNQIGVLQQKFQNISIAVEDFEGMVQEKETLQEEVKCLKETLAECESDSRKCQLPKPEKPDDYDERLKPLRYENSRLKTELKMSASAVSFPSEEIHELMATTNQLTKKLRKMSLENDDLTLKLAASPNIKKNQENQPDDSDELTQLRDENSKLKTQFEMSESVFPIGRNTRIDGYDKRTEQEVVENVVEKRQAHTKVGCFKRHSFDEYRRLSQD